MNTPELSVLAAFIGFLLLCGRKLARAVLDFVDDYIISIKKEVAASETIDAEAQQILEDAKLKGEIIKQKIKTMEIDSKKDLANLKKEYHEAIVKFEQMSQKTLNEDLQFERASLHKELIQRLEERIITRIKDNFANKPFEVAILKDYSSSIKQLFDNNK